MGDEAGVGQKEILFGIAMTWGETIALDRWCIVNRFDWGRPRNSVCENPLPIFEQCLSICNPGVDPLRKVMDRKVI